MPESTTGYPHADLEFGVFDWVDRAGERSAGQTYEERLTLLRRADAGDFARYHLAEHHGTPLGLAPSPALFLAAAARETSRIRLVATTFIVPLYDPLRLVQEIGMLDQLSGGRVEVGVGKGSSPHEAAMFGYPPPEMARRYARSVPVILSALRTGVFVPPVDEGAESGPIELFVRPVQTPHPPLWYPTSNPESIPRLAHDGYHTIFGFGFASPPLAEIRPHSRTFFEIRDRADAAHGVAAAANGPPRFGMLRHIYVADTDAEARDTAQTAFTAHFQSFSHLWRKAGSDRFTRQPDLDDLVAAHRLFIGSPATVADQVAHSVQTAEVNYVVGAFAWGSLSVEQSLRSMELFDGEVIPRVRHAVSARTRAVE
jgi:alkanesulfonate monooxygenase SsuD/methylene tetrahydromethanopterin reductase-like flavin-dependent oxidoreductase (luciferase family)